MSKPTSEIGLRTEIGSGWALRLRRYLAAALALGMLGGFAHAQAQLTIWTHPEGGTIDWLEQEVERFEALFDSEVSIVDKGQLSTLIFDFVGDPQADGAADLLLPVPHDTLGQFQVEEQLRSVTQIATDSYLADLNQEAREAFTQGGTLVGLPLFRYGPALIVNRALVETLPSTLEELLELSLELGEEGVSGLLFDIGNFYFAYGFLRARGGYIFGRDPRGALDPDDIGLDHPGSVQGAELLFRLVHEGVLAAGTDYQQAHNAFLQRRAAMTIDGPWALASYRRAGLELSILPLPVAEGGRAGGFMTAEGILLNQHSRLPTQAANLAKWLTRPAAQTALARERELIPASQGALEQLTGDTLLTGFAAALEGAEPVPHILQMGRVWNAADRALRDILEHAEARDEIPAILSRAASWVRGE